LKAEAWRPQTDVIAKAFSRVSRSLVGVETLKRRGVFSMKSFWHLCILAACVMAEPAFAQKLVDPNKVAPEYREAAEKRRAEQIKQLECRHQADVAKVLPRDRTAAINRCLEDGPNPTTAAVHQ
jgi:hypothetical protein